MNCLFKSIALCTFIFSLAGCATVEEQRMYRGDPKDRSEVAILTVPNAVDVLAIDGERIPKLTKHIGVRERVYELLPGTHTITARYYLPIDYDTAFSGDAPPDRSSPVDLRLEAAAGATYTLNYAIDGNIITLSLGNTTTGSTITPVDETIPEPAKEMAAAVEKTETPTLKALKQAWGEASTEERKDFRKWIVDAP